MHDESRSNPTFASDRKFFDTHDVDVDSGTIPLAESNTTTITVHDLPASHEVSATSSPQVRQETSNGGQIGLPGRIAAGGLMQLFGLHPAAAVLAIMVDLLVFGGSVASLGLLWPVSLFAAGVLGFITYRIQMNWAEDESESALIKAWIIALLTAIPVPITPLIAIPTGLIGIASVVRRRMNW